MLRNHELVELINDVLVELPFLNPDDIHSGCYFHFNSCLIGHILVFRKF